MQAWPLVVSTFSSRILKGIPAEPDAHVELTLSYLPDKANSSCIESLVEAMHALLAT